MKKLIMLIAFGLIIQVSYSQTNVVEFLKGGKEDASKFAEAYMKPYAFALGDGLNNGWYSSAKTHHLFGFDLTLAVSAVQVPNEAKTFDVTSLGLENMTVLSGGNFAPTVAGKDVAGPEMQIKDDQGNQILTFNSPSGTGLDIVPVPMAQIGFGLLPHTDVMFRYVPDIKYNNNGDEMKVGLWGLGLKHNFMEWIPVLNKLPFDASIFTSYSVVNAQSGLSLTVDDYGSDTYVSNTFTPLDNQFLKMKTKTTKVGLVVSKQVAILTVFGGLGYSSSKSTLDLTGKYPVISVAQNGDLEFTDEGALIDPIAIEFSAKNISMDLGIRLKLAFFGIFASINKAEYTSYNAGVSLGFR
ncbi:MAG TPA: DUF6588 family protein [Prolixibacteraceae bacterium]|nr:DUF6588 family protein [Prolixibacteraceae bacterium]